MRVSSVHGQSQPRLLALQQLPVGRDLQVEGNLDLQQLLVLLGVGGDLLVEVVYLVILLGHVSAVKPERKLVNTVF